MHIDLNMGEERLVKPLLEAEKARLVNSAEIRQNETLIAKRKRGGTSSHGNKHTARITD